MPHAARRWRPVRVALCAVVLGWPLLGTGAPVVHAVGGPGWVAYQSGLRGDQFGVDGLFLVHPDGSGDHEIATSLPGQHIHPDWSADGRSLVFRADVGDYSQLF